MLKRDLYFSKMIPKLLLLSVLSFFLFGTLFYSIYRYSVHASNQAISSFVFMIQEKYPDISEEEIFEVLDQDVSTDFFRDYGFDLEDMPVVSSIQNKVPMFLFLFVLFWGCSSFLLVFLFYRYSRRNTLEIEKILKLIDDINHKIYTISLEEHKEDSFSLLRSELYKTTLMLKEQAENERCEKLALKNSLSDISHQIKTPLTSILILLDTFSEYPDLSDSLKEEFLEDIRGQISRIHFLTMTLLKLARFDSGVIQLRKVPIDGKELISSVVQNLDILSSSKNISYEIQGDNHFIGDSSFLEEAFMNILKNSIEASYENGKIRISMIDNPIYVKFTIQDFGCGIDSSDLPHIFERFYKSSTSSSSSIGIGLSLSKKIIEEHQGSITCDSSLGKGTTFEIRFTHH